ncbi:MAG: hypothetical protein GXP38_08220 [Chloroflexi bacterium]|nr:hypothetical protein [Chloroflexota bacterium]
MARRSVLVITHRLLGMEQMDEIVVLRSGRILEQGSHDELIAAGGLYHRLWTMQHEILQ